MKKLKKYSEEKNYLDEILDIIRNSKDFDTLLSNPLSKMYGMERLKYELNKFYSLNPSKHMKDRKDYINGKYWFSDMIDILFGVWGFCSYWLLVNVRILSINS